MITTPHYERAGRPACTELKLKRAEKRLDLLFADGAHFSLSAELLRIASPSAEVQGHGPGQRTLPAGRARVAIIGIEPVGNYAVRLKFDDLHDTGLYSWNYLYDLGCEQAQIWEEYLADLAKRGLSREPGP